MQPQLRGTLSNAPTPSTPNERKQQAMARVLGKNTFQEIDWRQLMQEGVLVRLTIRHCSFTARLEFADLGMSVQDESVRRALARTLKLGEKRLLPQRYLDAISRLESGARRSLAKNAFQTELGAFLPVTAYGAWKQEIAEHERRFLALRDEILEQYDELIEEVLKEYRVIARDTYRRLQTLRPDALDTDEAGFVANYSTHILALIPTREHIRERFGFDIVLRDGVQDVQSISDIARTPTPIQVSQVREQAENRTFLREQMQRDLVQQLRAQQARQVEDFLETIVTRLRSLAYEVMGDVLASIQKRGESTFPARSVVQLKNLVAQLIRLNFYGDLEMDAMLEQVQKILAQTPANRKRDLAEIQERLRAIGLVARSTLLDLNQSARSNREQPLPNTFSPAENVRQARLLLGLDLETIAAQQPATARGERANVSFVGNQPSEASVRQPRLV